MVFGERVPGTCIGPTVGRAHKLLSFPGAFLCGGGSEAICVLGGVFVYFFMFFIFFKGYLVRSAWYM